ncbi:MAG TPA: MBOAT family O-acyltransferase, partial [Longimicrobium sp.]|nr:MBOAT family O-acyltransferase [Longimicrobium sp.]
MIFASYTYALFLGVVFLLYWAAPERARKPLLVAASYLFYCTWKLPFGLLLLAVSLFNWAYGRYVLPKAKTTTPLVLGVLANLAPLLYFKYTNFLIGNAAAVVDLFGADWHPRVADILLPLGISFFTFQGIAYLFDVATGEEPFESLLDFLLFKAFWPQLIAGPIVRPGEIREQIETPRVMDYANVAEGCRRIVFGLFKKVVLADSLAPVVDTVFLAKGAPFALDAIVGVLGFGMQIYFDFSAYSDIAIGSARLFGYRFPENFAWPYVSRSPQEFWNRWHMTLSRWIRDYLFTPLTFASRRRPKLAPVWLLVAMAACGLWHGAQWTFVVWGVWHGLLLVLNQTALKPLFAGTGPGEPARYRLRGWVAWGVTMVLVFAGWLLFRAHSLAQAADMAQAILTFRGGAAPAVVRVNGILTVFLIAVLMAGAQV